MEQESYLFLVISLIFGKNYLVFRSRSDFRICFLYSQTAIIAATLLVYHTSTITNSSYFKVANSIRSLYIEMLRFMIMPGTSKSLAPPAFRRFAASVPESQDLPTPLGETVSSQ